jgi:arginase
MKAGVPTLLGIPYDASSSFLRGAADAPTAIRRALRSDSSNLWSESLVDLGAAAQGTAEAHGAREAFDDAGDASLGSDPRGTTQEAVAELLRAGARPVVLGGDHSITYPVVCAVSERHAPLSILHFDAHNDLYDVYDGDRSSHACPFARIMELRLADQLVQVGIRAMTGHQRQQADRFGVEVIDMQAWAGGRRPALRHPVYISLDVDVLDPAFAPGVSHREAGGLTTREVVTVLQAIDVPVVGADLVEFNPRRDVGDLTASACAKLLKELIAAMLRHPLPASVST